MDELANAEIPVESLYALKKPSSLGYYVHSEVGSKDIESARLGRYPASVTKEANECALLEAKERALASAGDAPAKKFATEHTHPKTGVFAADGVVCSRCCSDPQAEEGKPTHERADIFATALASLTVRSVRHKAGIKARDSTRSSRDCFGRYTVPWANGSSCSRCNFFDRPSALKVDAGELLEEHQKDDVKERQKEEVRN